jgi:UDP-glucose 4-epimerase
VTGGAGYIGSHVVRSFLSAGVPVVVLDNLVTGRREFVPKNVTLVEGSLADTAAISLAIREHSVTGVVHIAGYKFAGLSVGDPLHTYEQNVVGTMSLLRAMTENGVSNIVFSSSSSVYGTSAEGLVDESHPFNPTSPYGESKVVGEWLLRNTGHAAGLRHTSLRYFNVVGSGYDDLPDVSPHNLLSMVFAALERGEAPIIFGNDYNTPDGTCIRDYIHVSDLAEAHVAAARRMESGLPLDHAYNLGSGTGTSVAEMMRAIATVTEHNVSPVIGPRRQGDPDRVVASGQRAAEDLGWAMSHSLEQMILTAWTARRREFPSEPGRAR